MKIDLADDDVEILGEVLDTALADLTSEIAHTDNRAYRQALKDRRERLRGLAVLFGNQNSTAASSPAR